MADTQGTGSTCQREERAELLPAAATSDSDVACVRCFPSPSDTPIFKEPGISKRSLGWQPCAARRGETKGREESCEVPQRAVTGDKASDAARPVLWKTPHTFVSCCSDENPKPNTVLALLSAHCPNFCDVLVKVMLGVIVLFIITCRKRAQRAETSALNETPQWLLTKSSIAKARTEPLKQAPSLCSVGPDFFLLWLLPCSVRYATTMRGNVRDVQTDCQFKMRLSIISGKKPLQGEFPKLLFISQKLPGTRLPSMASHVTRSLKNCTVYPF